MDKEKRTFMKIQDMIRLYQPCNEQEIVDQALMLKCMDEYEDIFTRENALAHFTASSWVVNQQRTKVLMVYHNIMDSWAWTGGHADGEKDLLEVAVREAKEETGVVHIHPVSEAVYSLEVLPVSPHVKRGRFVNAHVHLNVTFLLEAQESDQIFVKEDENSAVKWVTIEEAPRLAKDSYDQILYQKLNDKLGY